MPTAPPFAPTIAARPGLVPGAMLSAVLAFAALALPALPARAESPPDAAPDAAAAPPAGLLAAPNRQKLPPVTLAAGQPLGGPWVLKSGTYYRVTIAADGSQELALTGAEFFRAIWIDEVVIEGVEVRPLGLDSLEFDEAAEARLTFIAIRPGTYTLRTPQGGADQALRITIE